MIWACVKICWTHQEFHVDCCPLRVKLDNVCILQSGCIYTWGGPWGDGRGPSPLPSAHFRRRPRIIPSIALELSSFPSRLSSCRRRAPQPHVCSQTPPLPCVHLSALLMGTRFLGAHAIIPYRGTNALFNRESRCSSFLHNTFGDKGGRRISRFTHYGSDDEFATPRQYAWETWTRGMRSRLSSWAVFKAQRAHLCNDLVTVFAVIHWRTYCDAIA